MPTTDELAQVRAVAPGLRVVGEGDSPPAVKILNLPSLDGWEPGRVWQRWKIDPQYFHAGGAMFGGYIAALADSLLGLVSMTVLDDSEAFTTSDLRISFFRAAISGTLTIEGRVIHRGRSMAHVEVDFTRDDGKLVAKATATQIIVAASVANTPQPQ
ncbi:MAG: PaaI family thioesterase [Myxococcales bacterium]|nr:PaaI family thioesterase [Myxococcales bacterium]